MTLNYNKEIMSSHPWTFIKLLFNWRASIWKAVYLELLCWLALYAVLSVIYRCALSEDQMRSFEYVVGFFESRLSYIPLDLVLGFFVTRNVDRWVWRYRRIGFLDNVGLMVAEYIRGHNETGRRIRRDIIRYCELGQILVFRDISLRARKRFPTLDTIVAAGFMRPDEKIVLEQMRTHYAKHWVPFQWAHTRAYEARELGHIESDYFLTVVTDEIRTFKFNQEENVQYDWTPLPMAYSNVVCLAVHFYFIVAVIGRQFVISEDAKNKTQIDMYFPLMPVLQFVFYMGWLKVAEVVVNPFGEDDDDWETNALIDRNITMCLKMADEGFDRAPELRKDQWWNDFEVPPPLYSEHSTHDNGDGERGMHGSASHVRLAPGVREIHMVRRGHGHHHGAMNGHLHLPRRHTQPHRLEEGGEGVHVPVINADQAMPKRPSMLSLEGLRKIRSFAWLTHHNNRVGESSHIIRPPSPVVPSIDALKEVPNGKATFVDIELDEHAPKPSAPVEVSPPPTHPPPLPEGLDEYRYVSDLDPGRTRKITAVLPPKEDEIADEHLYCSDLDPQRVNKLHERVLKMREKESPHGSRRSSLPKEYGLPRRPL